MENRRLKSINQERRNLNLRTLNTILSDFVKNKGEVKFAFVQVTTRCNAKCTDRCNIWSSKPFDLPLENAKFAIDVLAKNHFSIIYFTGGETALYPHLIEVTKYAKDKGLITSITTNGTISKSTLKTLRYSLDVLSISVDHYNEHTWDETKCIPGISSKAKEVIKTAKELGIKLYAITFLNPSWTVNDVENVVRYVNEELGISFALSYPYISSNYSTFVVGGNMNSLQNQTRLQVRNMVAKVLQMKLDGSDVATVSGYMRDVLRAHDNLPMRYPCKAGEISLIIDCNLDVFTCFKRQKLFNLKERQDLSKIVSDNSACDNKNCLINCFKESSLASKQTIVNAAKEELLSNPKFYLKLIH